MAETEWHPASEPPPEGLPVGAEYHPFNQPEIPVREHVVWWMNGAYRPCYNFEGKSWCTRWRHLPAIAERDAEIARLSKRPAPDWRYRINQRVTKTKGSSWTGRVVGFYSTELTPEGYAVESENEPGSVQIYPVAALEPKP